MSVFDKKSILFYIFVGFVLIVCVKMYYDSEAYNLKCIISTIDGETYCVREREKLQLAADLLAKVAQKCKDLVLYCAKKHPDNEDVQRLMQKFNPRKITETLPTSEFTAYSENKGEKVAFCLDRKKGQSRLIDLNTLTFVAIHEMSHIMTKSEGHKQEFWQNFKFLLENAKDANIYKPVDYKNKPHEFCGMKITDNPLYDL